MQLAHASGRAGDRARWVYPVFLCLFLLTGATGLVYEVVWQRLLGHVFGDTAAAATTVLAAYMWGLAVGALTIGTRAVRRGWATLRAYAALEAGVALYALAVPALLAGVQAVHVAWYPALVDLPWVLTAVRFTLAFAVLAVPTTLMGATLPILAAALATDPQSRGRRLGLLYGLNTCGAVCGCVLAGFVGLRLLGVTGTAYAAVGLNLCVSAAAFILGAPGRTRLRHPTRPTAEPPWSPAVWGWAAVAVITGATALAYEVLWVRTLVFYLNNSTYAFTGMLATFLLGLAGGSLAAYRLLDHRRTARLVLVAGQVAVGLWALGALPYVQDVYAALGERSVVFRANFWGVPPAVILAKCAILMGLPALALGMAWPLVTALAGLEHDLSARVGHFYAINTLGACVGALAAGFGLLPALGVHGSLYAVGLVNLGLAAVLGLPLLRRRMRVNAAAIACTVLALLAAVAPQGRVLRRADEKWDRLLFARDTHAASVKVYTRAEDGHRVISINGYEVAGTSTCLREIQQALAHYPMLLHPRAKTALVIGFGAGGTSYGLTLYPLERIDMVELVPAVIDASRSLARVNHLVAFQEPRFHVILDDGRNYVQSSRRRYDIITVDAIDPKHAGNGHLYAREFYDACRARLNPSGVLVQWLPYHLLTTGEFKLVVRTFQSVFPETSLWFTPYYDYLLLVGTPEKLEVSVDHVRTAFGDPQIGPDARAIGLTDPVTWLATYALGPADVRALVNDGGPLNTYDRPRLEFFAGANDATLGGLPFEQGRGLPRLNLARLRPEERAAFTAALPRGLEAGRLLSRGRALHARRQFAEAREVYQRVARAFPEHSAPRFLLAGLADQVQDAIDQRLAALPHMPGDSEVLFELGTLYEQAGRPAAAEAYYRRALQVNPRCKRSRLNLGQLYARHGYFQRALAQFSQVLERHPSCPRTHYNLALVLHEMGNQQAAHAALAVAQRALIATATPDSFLQAHVQVLAEHLRATVQ